MFLQVTWTLLAISSEDSMGPVCTPSLSKQAGPDSGQSPGAAVPGCVGSRIRVRLICSYPIETVLGKTEKRVSRRRPAPPGTYMVR